MERLLCPIDFSEPSRHGATIALALARWFGARLTRLHVHQLLPSLVGAGPALAATAPLLLSDEDRQALTYSLSTFGGGGVEDDVVDNLVVEDTLVASAILQCAKEIRADLIVIGTQGRTRLERLGLGSVAESVLRRSPCPVLAVPPQVPSTALSNPAAIRRVLCAVDFSPHSVNALPKALQWASKAGAAVTALHVCEISPELTEPPAPEFEAYRDRVVSDARRRLAETVRELSPQVPVEQRLAVGRPAAEILRYARDHQADLIVMGVRGRSQLDLTFFGSTANRVVQRAECPVLTTHA